MTPAAGAWSLRRELLVRLLAPLMGVVAVSAVAGAHLWDEWNDGVFDADAVPCRTGITSRAAVDVGDGRRAAAVGKE